MATAPLQAKRKQQRHYNPIRIETNRAEVNKIISAAARLGLSPEELCEMSGMGRHFLQRSEAKMRTKLTFAPRRSSIDILWKTIKDLRVKQNELPLDPKHDVKAPAKVMVALTQDDVDQAAAEARAEQEAEEKARHLRNVTNPLAYTTPQNKAATVIKGLIQDQLDSMTLVELVEILQIVLNVTKE